jgi:D-hexose-6-phosphate mutarotase
MKAVVRQVKGKNSQPGIALTFGRASAFLYLQGSHITSWKPDGQTEVLWVSESANYAPNRAIRGGIPICWPWFGAYWGEGDRAQHGFARTANFELIDFEETGLFARARLRMLSDAPYPEWRNLLALEVEVSLSEALKIELITTNISDRAVEVGGALHTYFGVVDVTRVQIPELEGLGYRDKLQDFQMFVQDKPLSIHEETDRVFSDPPERVHLIDPGIGRTFTIESWGNTDLVVWNPWKESANEMADFDDSGYLQMLCVEPARALENRKRLQPEQRFVLGQSLLMA